MRQRNGVALLLRSVLVATVVAAIATLRAQQSSPQSIEQQRLRQLHEHLNKFPVADYDSPEDAEPEKRAKRGNKKYNRPKINKLDPFTPIIGGGNNDWEWALESTLPVKQSSAIIVGTVSDAKAFLSEDKTNIYSEYSVRVEDVLKNFNDERIKPGDTLITERQGGRVRLRAAGAISGFFTSGQNPPQVGRRYVLFLGFNKYDAAEVGVTSPIDMSHHLLTGYELRGGKVVALDDPGGMNFKKHDGMDEAALLDEIRLLLANPPQTQPE
jgi:hypothetical protein